MEERMIKMSKSGEGYFWIGGPGEGAVQFLSRFASQEGARPRFDYLHLHYRNGATLVAMGMPVIDGLRQMAMTATDTHSQGRDFFPAGFAHGDWNIMPITSVIEVQYAMAPGTALVQHARGRRHLDGDRRRCGNCRGRFRLVPGLEHAARQGGAGC